MDGAMTCFLRHKLHCTALADAFTMALLLNTRVGTEVTACVESIVDAVVGVWVFSLASLSPLVPGSKLTFFMVGAFAVVGGVTFCMAAKCCCIAAKLACGIGTR